VRKTARLLLVGVGVALVLATTLVVADIGASKGTGGESRIGLIDTASAATPGTADASATVSASGSVQATNNAHAAERGTSADNRYQYRVLDDGTVVLTRYEGSDKHLRIPSRIKDEDGKDRSVSRIGFMAFSGSHSLLSVKIPRSVKTIDAYAFEGCRSLKKIVIPTTLISVGQEAFARCSSLKSVVIPASVTSLGGYAFAGCRALRSAKLGRGLDEVPEGVFDGCTSLKRVSLGSHIKDIRGDAFHGCANLWRLKVPNALQAISDGAFGRPHDPTGTYVVITPRAAITKLQPRNGGLVARWKKSVSGDSEGYQVLLGQGRLPDTIKTISDVFKVISILASSRVVRSGGSDTAKTIPLLRHRKSYTVWVRPYRTISGRIYGGDWSHPKVAKVR